MEGAELKIKSGVRNLHLDGIRGLAALAVAIFHFFRSFYNEGISYNISINSVFVSSLWNGHFAVSVFFVLSGYIFFSKFYCEDFKYGIKSIIKRYLRLSVPILFVCITAYLIHKLGLFFNLSASTYSNSDWSRKWYLFDPSILLSIKESLWGDFFYFDANKTYNSNLWTISYELIAVIAIIFIALSGKVIGRLGVFTVLVLSAALSYGSHYFEFMLGAILSLLLMRREVKLGFFTSIILMIVALSMASLNLPEKFAPFSTTIFYPLAALIIIGSSSVNDLMTTAFSCKVLTKLGEHSFGLYLMHFLAVNSVASWVYIKTLSLPITFISYFLSTIAMTMFFTLYIETPWINSLNRIFNRRKVITSA